MSLTEAQFESLKLAAMNVSGNAWCPYSDFRVGAALLGADGRMFCGCNIENASYGLTICAERTAVAEAVAAGCREFLTLLIYTPTAQPTAPCGACRQVVAEFSPDLEVVSVCDGSDVLRASIRQLLPHSFGPQSLRDNSDFSD